MPTRLRSSVSRMTGAGTVPGGASRTIPPASLCPGLISERRCNFASSLDFPHDWNTKETRRRERMTEVMEMATSGAGETYGLVREGEEAFAWCRDLMEGGGPLPCFVRDRAAGGRCSRPATMEVYGLAFCEAHGQECKAGALEEFYSDADFSLERIEGGSRSALNPEVARVIEAARRG